ncbi:MAG: hypothetical protein EAZ15_05450 [Sphingobacteriales bacterium]|nr:MAG: hypothetical protein EAZ15_05450 [Sphingobacteriales bacterium]
MKFKIYTSLFSVLFLLCFISCKKTSINVTPPTKITKPVVIDNVTPPGNRFELTQDSLFLYAQQLYLWNTELPSYKVFNPRQYKTSSTDLENFENVLFQITRYGINPLTGKPYEYNFKEPTTTKYSYIDDLVANGTLSNTKNDRVKSDLQGNKNDIGYGLTSVGPDNNYVIFLEFVTPGSPCEQAGLSRGDYFTSINGFSFGSNYVTEIDRLVNEIYKPTVNLVGVKKNGESFNVTINEARYVSSPIYKESVINAGGKKIGYLAYASFTDANNSENVLTNAFANFSSAGVTDLIIDLRYNSGGYISTAQHLINLIAPERINGSVMFHEYFNETVASGKAVILEKQGIGGPFNITTIFTKPSGGLRNIQNVVFMITGSTASASELVINSLKPYINVKTVGETSYGKPVGFFPIRIDKYDVYMSMFSTKNSAGEGNYFAGLNPTYSIKDDPTKAFGDITDTNLAASIAYLTKGSFANAGKKTILLNGEKVDMNDVIIKPLNDNSFKGMIEKRK